MSPAHRGHPARGGVRVPLPEEALAVGARGLPRPRRARRRALVRLRHGLSAAAPRPRRAHLRGLPGQAVYWPSVGYRCVQAVSGRVTRERRRPCAYAKLRGYFEAVDAFVAPSSIMRHKMVEGGLPGDKMVHDPHVRRRRSRAGRSSTERERIGYAGRIDAAKGVEVLVDAHRALETRRAVLATSISCLPASPTSPTARRSALAGAWAAPGVTMAGHSRREDVPRSSPTLWPPWCRPSGTRTCPTPCSRASLWDTGRRVGSGFDEGGHRGHRRRPSGPPG